MVTAVVSIRTFQYLRPVRGLLDYVLLLDQTVDGMEQASVAVREDKRDYDACIVL